MAVIGGRREEPPAHAQTVEIVVANGYHPAIVEVAADVPLRLAFRRIDAHECSDRVVFSEPRLVRHLAPGAVTVVDLPAAGPGEVRFTCGMGRYRGRIVRRAGSGRHGEGGRGRPAWPWAILMSALGLLLGASVLADAPVPATWLLATLVSLFTAVLCLRTFAVPRATINRH